MAQWLHSLIPWGTDGILWMQGFRSPLLDVLFVSVTFLGEEYFYLAFLPLVYWCLDKRLGIQLSYLLMFSNYINGWLKIAFGIPRPADPRILLLRQETSPSFPSGHAQNATALWGYLMLMFKNWALKAGLLLLIVLIALSRVYVGVHFPQDIVGGAFVGAICLVAYVVVGVRIVGPWLQRRSLVLHLALGISVPLVLLFLYPRDGLGFYPAENAATVVGSLIGMSMGFALEMRHVRFSTAGPWWRRGARLLVGLLLVGMAYAGPKLALPMVMPAIVEVAARVARYGFVSIVVAFLAPWVFVRTRLADRSHTR